MKHIKLFEELNQSTYQKVANKIRDKYPGLAANMVKHSKEFGLNKPNFTLFGFIGNSNDEILIYKPESVTDVVDISDGGIMHSRGRATKFIKKGGKWALSYDEIIPLTLRRFDQNHIMDNSGNKYIPNTRKDAIELEKYLKQWEMDVKMDKRRNAEDIYGDIDLPNIS